MLWVNCEWFFFIVCCCCFSACLLVRSFYFVKHFRARVNTLIYNNNISARIEWEVTLNNELLVHVDLFTWSLCRLVYKLCVCIALAHSHTYVETHICACVRACVCTHTEWQMSARVWRVNDNSSNDTHRTHLYIKKPNPEWEPQRDDAAVATKHSNTAIIHSIYTWIVFRLKRYIRMYDRVGYYYYGMVWCGVVRVHILYVYKYFPVY